MQKGMGNESEREEDRRYHFELKYLLIRYQYSAQRRVAQQDRLKHVKGWTAKIFA